jgi:hypothetical protein
MGWHQVTLHSSQHRNTRFIWKYFDSDSDFHNQEFTEIGMHFYGKLGDFGYVCDIVCRSAQHSW